MDLPTSIGGIQAAWISVGARIDILDSAARSGAEIPMSRNEREVDSTAGGSFVTIVLSAFGLMLNRDRSFESFKDSESLPSSLSWSYSDSFGCVGSQILSVPILNRFLRCSKGVLSCSELPRFVAINVTVTFRSRDVLWCDALFTRFKHASCLPQPPPTTPPTLHLSSLFTTLHKPLILFCHKLLL